MNSRFHSSWLWPCSLILTIFYLSGTSDLATPRIDIWFSKDKVAHFFVFGLLTTSLVRIDVFRKMNSRGILFPIALTVAFGGVDELHQSFTPGRNMEFADWIADSLGSIVAGISYHYWNAYRKILEWPIRLPRPQE